MKPILFSLIIGSWLGIYTANPDRKLTTTFSDPPGPRQPCAEMTKHRIHVITNLQRRILHQPSLEKEAASFAQQ